MSLAEYDFVAQTSIAVCMACFVLLLWLLRRDGPSFAMPFAYLGLLLLNHVPGAIVPLMDRQISGHAAEVAEGIRLTAIGVVAFVIGVWFARRQTAEQRLNPQLPSRTSIFREDRPFWIFCLLGGWIFTFGLTPLRNLPSVGAVIYNGGAIWMLGVLLGLRWSIRNKRRGWTAAWFMCLTIYPAMILVTAGFLSYGATAALIVMCGLTVAGRGFLRVFVAIGLSIYLGLSLFSTYFEARDRIRNVVWSGAGMEQRLDAVSQIVTGWKWFNANDQIILLGFDLRLNQNYFVGLASKNLDDGVVDYLYGSSATDALLSLVPRALWPGKTVFGGSPEIVGKMTGLTLSSTTSFGVGNVMEFYINFGLWGLIGGFLILGWAMGRFDHRAALAEANGDYATTILFFLPCVALVQPLGSMVELAGSASSAWIAGYFWIWCWARWQERKQISLPSTPHVAR
jgi:hypothetical protein